MPEETTKRVEDFVPVDHDGDTLLLTEPEARLLDRLDTGDEETANDVDTTRDALEALGRLRATRLGELVHGQGLDAARGRLRAKVIALTAEVKDLPASGHNGGALPHTAGAIERLVTAYVRLGGDLELAPPGVPPVEETLDAVREVVKALELLSADDFPPRLEGLVPRLNTLEEAYRRGVNEAGR